MNAMEDADAFSREAQLLQAILKHLPQGVSVFDENLRLRHWNAPFVELLELPPESVYAGVPFEDLVRVPAQRGEYGPGDVEEQVRLRKELALRFQAHRLERTRPNGKTTLIQGVPLQIDERVAGFITTYTDISDRKQQEEALRQQHEALRTLIDSLPVAVSFLDDNLDLVAYNGQFKTLLDLPEELFAEGRPSFERITRFNAERGEYGPVDVEEYVAEAVRKARLGIAHHFERTRPSGRTLEVRGVPLPAGGFVTIYADISERKAHERDVQQLNEDLENRVVERTESLTLANAELESAQASLREALREVEAIFETAFHGIILLKDRKIVRFNRRFQEMTGYTSEELNELPARALYADEMAYRDAAQAYERLKVINRYAHEQLFRRKDGSEFWAHIMGSAIDTQNPWAATVWLIEDISERKEAESKLRHANEMLSQTVTALETRDRQVSILNRAHDLLLSCHTRDEAFKVVTSLVQQLFPGTSGALATGSGKAGFMTTMVRWGESGALMEDQFEVDDCWAFRQGRPHEVADTARDVVCGHFAHPLPGPSICLPLMVQGRIFGSLWLGLAAGAAFDHNQRQLLTAVADAIKLSLSNLELREALRDQASRDPLTNLFNRRYMMETLERELARAQRYGHPFCLAIMDLDHFKAVNDTFGHDAGDTALKYMANLLLEHTRGSDVVCRHGGEEFVVLLPDTSLEKALLCIDKVRRLLGAAPVTHGGREIGLLTFSAGIATLGAEVHDARSLVTAADAALYKAKEGGRNLVLTA